MKQRDQLRLVFEALDVSLGRHVALKTLPPGVAADGERLRRFQQEARAVAALNHPNIVTIHSVEEADGVHFLTMELIEGATLDASIRRGGMPLGDFFDVAVPLAEALSAAHEKGIVHRDLKPANVMVTREGRVKVLDFGLAKLWKQEAPAESEPTRTVRPESGPSGTVPYMSPEQLQGKEPDQRSDIFSLGIILYEMSTGERPFKGDTAVSLLSSILKDHPPPVTEISRPTARRRILDRGERFMKRAPGVEVRSGGEGVRCGQDATTYRWRDAGMRVRTPRNSWLEPSSASCEGC